VAVLFPRFGSVSPAVTVAWFVRVPPTAGRILIVTVERGLASGRPGRVVKYGATAPELALERLVGRRREELAEVERETSAMIEEPIPCAAKWATPRSIKPLTVSALSSRRNSL
jgi:hypothetical protein